MNKLINDSFRYPTHITRLVICDFDETYMPYLEEKRKNSGIPELENFVNDNVEKLSILLGWVTGSSLRAILRKSNNYVSTYPHFIACSLGSEFYWVKNGQMEEDEDWNKQITKSGFDKDKIETIVQMLQNRGFYLTKQIDDYQGRFLESFYLPMSKKTNEELMEISELASEHNIKAIATKCNPAAGDPANCFDIQFMPKCCGKKEVLQFLKKKLGIKDMNTWAFGDSFNDLEILQNVGNPYIVANADSNLIEQIPQAVLKDSYCYGIKNVLVKLLP